MDKKTLFALATIIVLGAAYATYMYWQSNQPEPVIIQAKTTPPSPPSPPPEPVVSQVTEAPPAPPAPPALPPLPPLAKSDSFVFDAVAGLADSPSLMKLFHVKRIIHRIVVTVDNLPQERVPLNSIPLKAPSGRFLVDGTEDDLTISAKNTKRYTPYVRIAEAVDAKKLVGLYVRLYPLFQQSYKELGYPNDSFNDQLNDTLDELLDTPDVEEPIKLVQPKYFYLYADPEIEARSVGQKIMLRLGSKNMKIVKNKLSEIKQELALRTKDLKAD